MTPALSIVLPVYNEAENLGPLWQELYALLPSLAESVEVIFVDDGSTDGSTEILQRLAKEDPRVRLIRFEANAGLSASFYAGLQATRGRVVATMDSDMQNDPRDIAMLMQHLGEADAVVGWRQVRHDSWLKRVSSRIANAVRKGVTGDSVQDSACSLRVMRREGVVAMPPFTGMHRFMPTLLKIAGFRVIQVRVNHRPRKYGRSKFGVSDRAFSAFADLLVVRWMMVRRLRYRIAEQIDSTGGDRH